MGFKKKQPAPEEAPGAPQWMLTFSDCVTLLLTFFVLLITFSAPGNSKIKGMGDSIAKFLPGFDWADKMYRDSMSKYFQFYPAETVETGSEKPTLEEGTKGNLKKTIMPSDFDAAKVFSIPSGRIFCGRGTVISSNGREVMTAMASFLRKVPNRVVICEHSLKENKGGEQIGLQRALTVMEYLSAKHGLNKKRFSISGTSTMEQEGFEGSLPDQPNTKAERMLEIILLDRSIYN
jgi:chemotaxis protein MotB